MEIIIYGAGKTGSYLTRILTLEGHNITVIEADSQTCNKLAAQYDVSVIESKGIKSDVFTKENFSNCDLFIAVGPTDEMNIMASYVAKKVGATKTVARVRNEDYAFMQDIIDLRAMGIDLVIHPEKELAKELINLVTHPNAIDIYELFAGEILMVSTFIKDNADINGKTLKDISQKYSLENLRAVAIEKEDGAFVPDGNYVVSAGDKIYAVTTREAVDTVFAISGYQPAKNRDIMINGSGKIAEYIALALEKNAGFNTKIIVEDEKKADRFSELLHNTLIVHGTATDIDILVAEGILEMDFFLALTGNDENNIVSSLFANHLEVEKTITRIEKTDYLPVTKTIGLQRVINSSLATSNAIMRFVRSGKIVSSLSMKGINFDLITFSIKDKNKYIQQPLMKIHKKFPPNSLIAAISRHGSYFIPSGNDEIQINDEITVFVEKTSIPKIEKMFGK